MSEALILNLKQSEKFFMDENRAPILDPGARKTETRYLRALARDDCPWNGGAPPGIAFTYRPGRGGQYAEQILQGFSGVLQVDRFGGCNRLIEPERVRPKIQFAYCWAHIRRKLIEITRTGQLIVEEGVRRIRELYQIEADLRGRDQYFRLSARQERSALLIVELENWFTHHRACVAARSPLDEALKYIARYWEGLSLFLADARIELDNNGVDRTIQSLSIGRTPSSPDIMQELRTGPRTRR